MFYCLLEAQNFKCLSFRQWSVLEQLEIKILDKLKELNIFTLIYVQKGFFIFLVTFNKQVHSKHFIIVSSQLLLFVMGLKLFLLLSKMVFWHVHVY